MTLSASPVLIEWLDSAQPIPTWHLLTDLPAAEIVRCELQRHRLHSTRCSKRLVALLNWGTGE